MNFFLRRHLSFIGREIKKHVFKKGENKVKIIAGIGGEQSLKRTEKRKTGWENKRKENQPGNM